MQPQLIFERTNKGIKTSIWKGVYKIEYLPLLQLLLTFLHGVPEKLDLVYEEEQSQGYNRRTMCSYTNFS